MKKHLRSIVILIITLATGIACEDDMVPAGAESLSLDGSASSEGGGTSTTGGNGNGGEAGVVTAAEWNDLEHWNFWSDLINGQDYGKMPEYWDFYTNNRVSFKITHSGQPVSDVSLELQWQNQTVWNAKTDNLGTAELWVNLFVESNQVKLEDHTLLINGAISNTPLKKYSEGVNEIELSTTPPSSQRVEIAFMVDATGSMGDELEFLKKDLVSVIERVEANNMNTDFFTGTVFYRDVDDDYLVRHSPFSNDITVTSAFIQNQSADGGGDYPEAVHTALTTTLTELQWSTNARAKIIFLLLDAPPHYEEQIIDQIQGSVKKAAQMGVKLIPITASGIDKETEFLMRFMAVATNGTYVFITDDSGVGNSHLEASVGQYEVEKLNDLIVRIIDNYSKELP